MMDFDADLFLAQAGAPVVPVLGPVHPAALRSAIQALLAPDAPARGLPFDKNQRWGTAKRWQILFDHIFQDSHRTILPVRVDEKIEIHFYGVPEMPARFVSGLRAAYPQAAWQVVVVSGAASGADNIVFLAESEKSPPLRHPVAVTAVPRPAAAALAGGLAREQEHNGFLFLQERLVRGFDDGEILAVVEDGAAAGMLGPLSVTSDAAGQAMCHPPFFGVAGQKRRQGIATALWSCAMDWMRRHGAAYIVLQAAAESPAAHFYRQTGLVPLGGVSRINIAGEDTLIPPPLRPSRPESGRG